MSKEPTTSKARLRALTRGLVPQGGRGKSEDR
jgi:hypothetical protein